MKKQKILICRLGAIGDVVHTTVIAQAMKQKYPDSEIHYLTASTLKPLLELCPYVDKIYEFNRSKKDDFFYLLQLALEFKKQKYDLVFRLSNSLRDIFLSTMCFAKKILKRKKCNKHAVEVFFETANDYVKNLEKQQSLNFSVNKELKEQINEKLKNYPRPYFVLNPAGANNNVRQGRVWSEKNWKELAQKLTETYGGTVFICGSDAEKNAHKFFEDLKNTIILTGELNLVESAAVYSCADLMISGDSGPLHIADALGVNLIALMGSTSPEYCGPYSKNEFIATPQIDCKYCQQKKCSKLKQNETITPCMNSISVNQVIELVENALNASKLK